MNNCPIFSSKALASNSNNGIKQCAGTSSDNLIFVSTVHWPVYQVVPFNDAEKTNNILFSVIRCFLRGLKNQSSYCKSGKGPSGCLPDK